MVKVNLPLNLSTTETPINVTGNSTFQNTTSGWSARWHDRTPVILSVSTISLVAVFSNLTLLLIILSRKELRSVVLFWNVAGMCVCNLVFGTITNALGDSRHIYNEWLHGAVLCKLFSVFKLSSTHIMSMIQITIVTSLFLKVRQSLSPPSNVTSRVWTAIPYFLFVLPWLVEVALFPMIILGEIKNLPDFAKKYSSLMCYHFMERNYRYAGVFLFSLLFFIVVILSIALFLYYRFKKASYDRLLADDAVRHNETLHSMLIATLGSSTVFSLFFAPYILNMLVIITCNRSWCRPNIKSFDAVYVLGCVSYAITPIPWFAYVDIKYVFTELMNKVKGCVRSSVSQCRGCCRTRLESITVEWSQSQSDVMKRGK
ncbi:uncharacterized protein LOC134234839 [Saccostrea cucullata]|uniref:uncharacterized protein LOC134234839 n=1 Tax=Saccostrea cuccullata TaxID=36930 RepID=UPI002ED39D8B